MAGNFKAVNETRATPPRVAFDELKNEALGRAYGLTLIFVSPARIKKLNLIYRGKNRATDILSFPLSKSEGEIYLCLAEIKKEARREGLTLEKMLSSLFIHGCVHLKGYDHGATMERIEQKIRNRFGI